MKEENLKYKFQNGIMSKELFVETIAVIQKKSEYDSRCNKVLGEIFEDGGGFLKDYFIISYLLDLLDHMFYPNFDRDTFSDIQYFIYDLDFGKDWTEHHMHDQDGKSIDISTSEKLYDYLTNG